MSSISERAKAFQQSQPQTISVQGPPKLPKSVPSTANPTPKQVSPPTTATTPSRPPLPIKIALSSSSTTNTNSLPSSPLSSTPPTPKSSKTSLKATSAQTNNDDTYLNDTYNRTQGLNGNLETKTKIDDTYMTEEQFIKSQQSQPSFKIKKPAGISLTTMVEPPKEVTICFVMYEYEAQSDREISIFPGEEIKFLDEQGEWIKGEITDPTGDVQIGWFPGTYVEKRKKTIGVENKPNPLSPKGANPLSPTQVKSNPLSPKGANPLSPTATQKPNLNFPSSSDSPQKIAKVLYYEKRRDTFSREAFYLFVIQVGTNGRLIYRRVSEFRALSGRLADRFPGRVSEIPPIKESIFTMYGSLLAQLYDFIETICSHNDEIANSDVFQNFLQETPVDKNYLKSEESIVSRSETYSPNGLMSIAKDFKTARKIPSVFMEIPESMTAEIVGLVKVGEGMSRHYEYEIDIIRDGQFYKIWRRYSEFYAMQETLFQKFPEENNPSKRTLPSLPSKIFMGRSQTQEVAEQRMPELQKYMRELLYLDPKIKYCEQVLLFFAGTEKDRNMQVESISAKRIETSSK